MLRATHAQAPQLTTIDDVVYRANGAPASGSVVISWPAFSTADQRAVAAGEIAFPIATGGVLNVNLAPNEGATPSGSYYKVVYKLSDGTTSTEYWVVPATSPATIAAIRSSVVPRTMAAQLVTRQYVDNVLQGNDVTLVHRSGSESISGVKAFTVSPTVPTPTSNVAVANKSYVDAAVTAVSAGYLNKSGDTMLGALTLVGDPVATNQAANKHYVDLSQQSTLTALGQKLDRANDTPTILAGIRFGSQFVNLQAAVTDAGTTGAMIVNPDYPGIDSYTNPNSIALLDFRGGGSFQLAEVDAKKVGNVRQCHKFPGANAGAKIAACIADLPATGGTADACGFEGPQTISSTIAVNKRTTLRVCAAQFTATVSPAFTVTADFFVDGANRIASTFKAASSGVIFQGGGNVKYFGLKDLTLNGNGAGSRAFATPNAGGGVDWSQGRITITNVLVQDFGDYAIDLGQSTYFTNISEALFLRNIGSVNAEWAADFTVKNSNFGFPATNATYPNGRPQVKLKGGSTFTIADSDFERNDAPNPTGSFQAADIYLEATSPSGAPGYGWIRNNKFGGEGDSATRAKIQIASSTGSATDAVNNVVIAQNSFYGAPAAGGSQVAIKIDNPINRFRITQNYFAGIQTLIADNAALVSSDVGHSSFDATNVIVPVGGSAPNTPVTVFANGGRYFSNIAEVGNTTLEAANETPRDNETSELRNRVLNSENFGAWSATGVTITAGQTDPYGTSRASLLTAAGSIAAEQIFTTLDNTNRTPRLVVKFWAKAGTLNSVQVGLYKGAGFQGSIPLFTLGNTWKQYKFVYNGLDTATAHVLRIYPGNGNAVTGGNIYMFGVQVSDVDSDYVPTAGAAVAKTDTGNRYERKAEFANQIVSTVATGTAPFSVNSTTKVANLNADTVDGLTASELGGVPKPNTRHWGYVATTGGSMSSLGEAQTPGQGSCSTGVAPTSTDPAMTNCTQTSATINTVAGLQGAQLWRTGRNISLQWAGKVRENTSVRAWIGMTDQTLATMVGSDNPVGNYAAFRFSTSASDANVKCVTKDGSTQNIQPTSVTDLTAFHTYEVTEDVANARWHFYIDGAEVCGSGLTANLPGVNANLRFVAGQQNLVATQRNIDSGWVYVSADK